MNIKCLISSMALALLSASAPAATYNIDFGTSATTNPSSYDGKWWNSITRDTLYYNAPVSLIDSTGAASGVTASISDLIPQSDTPAQNVDGSYLDLPGSVARDFLWSNTVTNPVITFTGLNAASSYDFKIYARQTAQPDNRAGLYKVTGSNSKSGVINPTNNTTNALTLTAITPTSGGVITLDMKADVTNTSSALTFYLNAVKITSSTGGGGGVQPSASFINQNVTELITSNPGFESGTTGWASQYVKVQSTNVASGTQAGYLDSPGWYVAYPIRTFTAQAGAYYRLKVKLASLNLSEHPTVTLRFFDSAGTQLAGFGVTDETLSGTRPYSEFSSVDALAPAGTTTAKIFIVIGGGSTGTLYYDDFSLTKVNNLPVIAVPTYSSISVQVAKASPASGENAHVFYRPQGSSTWSECFPPVYDSLAKEYRASIVDLTPDTTYEVQALLESGGVVSAEAGVKTTTWSSSPPIASTVTIASLYSGSGELKIQDMHGSPTGWIKITGTGNNDINGGYNTTAGADNGRALLIKNCSYLIFDNVRVTGGRYHGIEVRKSEQIRILRSEISGWARNANVVDAGVSYESAADVIANRPIDYDAAVFLNYTKGVTIERCYAHDPRLGSNPWTYGHPSGPNAIYVVNGSRTGNTVVRYNDFIGNDKMRWNDSIEGYNNSGDTGSFSRDTDIYGNMLCFGNDDGIELDGGQKNIRFWGNRIESFYQGISLAPNRVGPSYIYRNVMFNMGDQNDGSWAAIKAGGGTTNSKGKSFIFHNTFYMNGNGLFGVGYGSDSNRAMFMALTRNNIFYSFHNHVNYRSAISDTSPNAWSSFDYDNLASSALSSAQVTYAAGQEAHGILNNYPTFMDVAGGDFRLASGSSALNAGQPLANFMEDWIGANPDQGAFESGDSSLTPMRPIAITANKYLVTLTATANGGSTTSVTVTLTTGNIGGATAYSVRKNTTDTAWLAITPTSGTLNNSSSQSFTFSVNTAGLAAGQREATVLVRLATGYSVPITVVAAVN